MKNSSLEHNSESFIWDSEKVIVGIKYTGFDVLFIPGLCENKMVFVV